MDALTSTLQHGRCVLSRCSDLIGLAPFASTERLRLKIFFSFYRLLCSHLLLAVQFSMNMTRTDALMPTLQQEVAFLVGDPI